MEKDSKEKIVKFVFVTAAVIFGFWILSFGFRILWEAVKAMFP